MPRLSSPTGLTATGALRMAIGAALLSRPTTLPRALGVDAVTAGKVRWLGSMLGARDLAIGAGLVHAVRRSRDPRPWLVAGAFADAVDALAFGRAVQRGQVNRAVGAVCVSAALGGAGVQLATLRDLQGDGQ